MRKHVVVYKKLPEDLLAALRQEFEVSDFQNLQEHNRPRFDEALRTAHGLIGASVRFDDQALAKAPFLEVISTVSVGYDTFDVPALSKRGIVLAHTPGVLTETTADTLFALILASARRVVELAGFVKAGRWQKSIGEDLYGVDVHSKTIGFIGMGRIGSAVARRAHLGFNMRVLYHNRTPVSAIDESCQAKQLPLDEVLGRSDFVCVVLPLTPETDRLIGARELALMQPGAIFINGSRGRIVDEAALIEALRRKQIRGAGLDVFEREPLPMESPLLQMPSVVCLPHIGSATHETRYAMARMAVDSLVAGLRGERPENLVNPEAWGSRAR